MTSRTIPTTAPADTSVDQQTGLDADLADLVDSGLERLSSANLAGAVPTGLRDNARLVEKSLRKLAEETHGGAYRRRMVLDDVTKTREHRDFLLAENRTQRGETIKQHTSHAEVGLARLEAKLTEAAIPTLSGADEPLARDEVKLMLDAAAERGSGALDAVVHELANDDDPRVVAVIAGSWGRSYLRARGAGDVHDTVRATALRRALTKGTAEQQQAARAMTALGAARAAATVLGSAAQTAHRAL